MEVCRNQCRECPWGNTHRHSKDWMGYVKKMESIGKIKDGVHACHMITSDTWGYRGRIDQSNVCVGSLNKKIS
jgi:hypothetical protein